MSLENHLKHRTLPQTARALAVSALLTASPGCYFIFGSVGSQPESPVQPTEFCMNRDMPKEWRGRKDVGLPVMFEGPKSRDGSCYYQTSEERCFEVDNRRFVWNIDCNGKPVWADQYYSGHGIYRNHEIYAFSVKFNRDRVKQK